MRKITIQDVARKLNLSRNTVAKALNNSETVSYETRCMVIKKAYEMGYSKLSPAVLKSIKSHKNLVYLKNNYILYLFL
jgi:LacI family transcriptional regulator